MNRIMKWMEQETVLCVAGVLAVLSCFVIHPDRQYISYIDFRTLGILFCLMAVVAGLNRLHLFAWLAQKLLSKIHKTGQIAYVLVMLCFVFSMLITNDVALISFVPFTIVIMHKLDDAVRKFWLLWIVILQTIAANLGSMLTPIGNPQNLYLFERSGMQIGDFVLLMLPYSVMSFVMLSVWVGILSWISRKSGHGKTESVTEKAYAAQTTVEPLSGHAGKLVAYGVLFVLSLLVVVHLLRFEILLGLVVLYLLFFDRPVFGKIDYALLATFVVLFVFIGNLGRIPVFRAFLQQMITGHETATAICASQVMSNVPAALLLSGFTDQISKLIIGVNLGGLGTLIASMASLISFKYIAKEAPALRGRYIARFTIVSLVFLAVLMVMQAL